MRFEFKPFGFYLAVLLFTLYSESGAQPQPSYKLGGIAPTDTVLTQRLHVFFTALGEKMGARIEIVEAPVKRLEHNVQLGLLDGLAYRSLRLMDMPIGKYLEPVPVTIGEVYAGIYALDSGSCLTSWKALDQDSGKWSYPGGYYLPRSADGMQKLQARMMRVDSLQQAFRLLTAGRTRYLVEVYEFVEDAIRAGKAPPNLVYRGTLHKHTLHTLMAKNRADAIAAFAAAQKALLADSLGPRLTLNRAPIKNPAGCAFGNP